MVSSGREQITEDQHFVPTFYLKKFTGEAGLLEILDIRSGEIKKRKNPSQVCYGKFFYAINTGTQDDISQQVESVLSEIESQISERYDNICKKILQGKPLLEEDRYTLALFMATLWIRSPYMRNMLNGMSEKLIKEMMYARSFHPGLSEEVKKNFAKRGEEISDEDIEGMRELMRGKEYGVEFDNREHLLLFGELEGFTNLCFGKKWRFYIAHGNTKFLTSDTPVTEVSTSKNTFYGNSFFERLHYLPLTPSILLELSNPFEEGKKVKRKWISDDKVLDFNLLKLKQTKDYAYAQKREDLNAMQKFHQKNHLIRLLQKIM